MGTGTSRYLFVGNCPLKETQKQVVFFRLYDVYIKFVTNIKRRCPSSVFPGTPVIMTGQAMRTFSI